MHTTHVNLHDENSLSHLVRELKKHPILTKEEEVALAKRWHASQDPEAARVLTQSHLRLLARIVAGYRGYGLPVHDLISEGHVGLMQAMNGFDPDRGFRFSTYAMWWIEASIKDFILRSWSLVKIGTTVNQKKLFFNLRRLKKKLRPNERYLHPEDIQTIAETLGVRPADVISMELRLSGHDFSLNTPVADDSDGEWQDFLVDEQEGQEAAFANHEELVKRRSLLKRAMDCLNARERKVLLGRRFVEPPLTLEALGDDLKVSRERVRQIEARAFEKLQAAVRHAARAENLEL